MPFKGQLDQEVSDLMKISCCIQSILAALEGQKRHRWDSFGSQWGHTLRDHAFFCLLSVFPLSSKLLPGAFPQRDGLTEAMSFLSSCLVTAMKITNIIRY